MSLYLPELYCQECYDLGRAIMKLNNYIRSTYWELCEPEQMRYIYKTLRENIIKFSAQFVDDDSAEEDLFIRYTQFGFQKLTNFIHKKTIQFPQKEVLLELLESTVSRLRDMNCWLESPTGQAQDWWRVYDQYQHMVINTLWTNSELMNFVPDNTVQNNAA
jgi:hypothetical protein